MSEWSPVALAGTIGVFVVLAVIMWGIFGVGREAVSSDRDEAREAVLTELVANQKLLLQGQKEAAEVLAELRGTTTRIEAMLREVG